MHIPLASNEAVWSEAELGSKFPVWTLTFYRVSPSNFAPLRNWGGYSYSNLTGLVQVKIFEVEIKKQSNHFFIVRLFSILHFLLPKKSDIRVNGRHVPAQNKQ